MKFKCEMCDKVFHLSETLKSHITKAHSGKGIHKCQHCKNIFFKESALLRHIQRIHEKTAKFKCNLCEKLFAAKLGLKYHYEKSHAGVGLFACNFCDKKFFSDMKQKFHEKFKHSKQSEHDKKCVTCNKEFPNRPRLLAHVWNQHNIRSYQCDICKKVMLPTSRIRHLQQHFEM